MKLIVNGIEHEYGSSLTGGELLDGLKISRATAVAEVNGQIVPREQFHSLALQDGDKLELVTVVGGG
jgi:sulfur carrier protein